MERVKKEAGNCFLEERKLTNRPTTHSTPHTRGNQLGCREKNDSFVLAIIETFPTASARRGSNDTTRPNGST